MKSKLQLIVGATFWLGVMVAVGAGWNRWNDHRDADSENQIPSDSILRYTTGQHTRLRIPDAGHSLRSGDPIFLSEDGGEFHGAGFVTAVEDTGAGRELVVLWYDPQVSVDECQLLQYRQSGRLSEVVETMLTPQKRKLIRERLEKVMQQHGDEVSRSLEPLLKQTMKESMPIIEDSFRASVARHRKEIDQLS
ncbi:MAG: hypothetical protein AAFV88_08680, partial [Planctomycetota bacterium]